MAETTESLAKKLKIKQAEIEALRQRFAEAEEAHNNARKQDIGAIAAETRALDLDDAVIRGAFALAIENKDMAARFRERGTTDAGAKRGRGRPPAQKPPEASKPVNSSLATDDAS